MGSRKILFIDRDGTLIREPSSQQVDTLEQLALVERVIPALLRLRDAGYTFVIVTNQDGLGTPSYPRERYELVQEKMLEVFRSQGIEFADILVCPHRPADNCTCRKPHLGLVRPYLSRGDLDLEASAVVGDRETDLALAANMGLRGFRITAASGGRIAWLEIARELVDRPRRGECNRNTRETQIRVAVELDRGVDAGAGAEIHTGIGFFDHMLDQLVRHGGFAATIEASGDLHVDEHHTIEDVGLALGEALRQAVGDKVGIGRYGFVLPMDEAQARAAIDLSGRPYFVLEGELPEAQLGGMSTAMVPHFFRSFAAALAATLHLEVSGENAHHMVEALFKVVGRAMRPALARTESGLPSTKGVL
jgi:imidazoleglycerol-phosphate dehydratase / histidinol-phosphatase